MLVFVYGTLCKGNGLSCAAVGGRFIGNATTYGCLYNLGAFPGAKFKGIHKVVGEVFDVSKEVMSGLDRREGHPHFYERITIQVELTSGIKAAVWAYEYRRRICRVDRIHGGDWMKFAHGNEQVLRKQFARHFYKRFLRRSHLTTL